MPYDVDLISLRFGRLRGAFPPLGAMSLSAAMRDRGMSCSITDTQFDPRIHAFAVDALCDWIEGAQGDVLAFSVFNDAIPLLVTALTRSPQLIAGRRVIVGGPGVVGIAERLLRRVPAISAVVIGEGESALPAWVRDPATAAGLSGVYTRDRGGGIVGAGRAARERMESLPAIDWTAVARKPYTTLPWSTMRGCPFGCEFCEIIAFMGRQVTARDVHSSVEDLARAVAATGLLSVSVLDDTFTVSKKRVLRLCDELRRRDLAITFEIFSRADTIDREMMAALASAGCVRIFFGLDSGDDDVLHDIAKGLSPAAAEETVAAAAEFFEVTASFIWGFPFEPMAAFERTLDMAERLYRTERPYPIRPQLHLLSPSAGTPLFDTWNHALVLDTTSETMPLGGSLDHQRFRQHHCDVTEVIESDMVLAAPFYRYQTPQFTDKQRAIDQFNAHLDADLGAAVARALTPLQEQCHA